MSILKIATPGWVSQIQGNQQQDIPQQRTVIPRESFVQGLQHGHPGEQKDTVPAMLRPGEEVITPETKEAMGGRDEMMDALNSKLKQKGLSLTGGTGPVEGGNPENKFVHGTAGDMRLAYAQGTMGIGYRKGYARGTTEPFPTNPSFTPGAITVNSATPSIQSMPPTDLSRKKLAEGTMGGIAPRKEYATGTTPIVTGQAAIPAPQPAVTPVVNNTDRTRRNSRTEGIPDANAVASKGAVTAAPLATATQQAAAQPIAQTQAITQQPVDVAPISAGVKGIGFQVTPLTESAYYKEPARQATEALQKQNAVANQQQAQNLAQQGVPATSAAAHTLTAEQNAAQESTMGQTQATIANNAAQQIQSDLSNTMQLAYQSGDWNAVNKVLASTGQQPIDFTNLEQQRQSGNLTAAAQTFFNLANSITGTDAASVATKSALMQVGTGELTAGVKTILGSQFDATTLNNIPAQIAAGNVSDPATQVFVEHVAPAISSWVTDSINGQVFKQTFSANPKGAALMTKAEAGDPNALAQVHEIATYAAAKASGGLNGSDATSASIRALLAEYGVDLDYNTIYNVDQTNQEGVPSSSAQIGNMLLGGANASEAGQTATTKV
jgi:hypothetical protein